MKSIALTITALAAVIIGVMALPGGTSDTPGGEDYSDGTPRLNLVAYSSPKPAFDLLIPAYRQSQTTGFAQSYGASGDQSRKVVRGVPTSIVDFSVEPDITRLTKAGIVSPTWKTAVPDDISHRSVPAGSVVSFVTRQGNPHSIETWDDLLKPGISVITPNPASSGSAKWNLLAPYASWFYQNFEQNHDPAQAHRAAITKLTALIHDHITVRPKSGREATSTFEQGQGDVLLSYENEAILMKKAGDSIDYFNPPQTFRIENPVAATSSDADSFRNYLFTPSAQKLWNQAGFRTGPQLFDSTKPSQVPSIANAPGLPSQFRPVQTVYTIDQLADDLQPLTSPKSSTLASTRSGASTTAHSRESSPWSVIDPFLFGASDKPGAISTIYSQVK